MTAAKIVIKHSSIRKQTVSGVDDPIDLFAYEDIIFLINKEAGCY
jgi:hypothetical protein